MNKVEAKWKTAVRLCLCTCAVLTGQSHNAKTVEGQRQWDVCK